MRIIFIDLLSKTQRSTSLKYLLASVAGLSFYPQWITHLLMTAGIDSNYKIPIQHFLKVPFCWLKLSTKFPTCYLSAVCFFFRELIRELNGKSDEVLTRQPDQHHRVVFQPPPSLDGGLDGQSMLLFLNIFYCLSKAMARLYTNWRDFSAHCSKLQARRAVFVKSDAFQFKAGTTPQDVFMHQ